MIEKRLSMLYILRSAEKVIERRSGRMAIFALVLLIILVGQSNISLSQSTNDPKLLVGNWISVDSGKQECWRDNKVADIPGSPDIVIGLSAGKLMINEVGYRSEFKVKAVSRNDFQQIVWSVEGTGFELGGEEKIRGNWTLIEGPSGKHILSMNDTVTHVRGTLDARSRWKAASSTTPRTRAFTRC